MNGRDPVMDVEAQRDLRLLSAVEEDARVTQRTLADKLGIALGLTNIYLRRLVRKGYIKCVNVQSNRITYLLTPRGIEQKTQLTVRFLHVKMREYEALRAEIKQMRREAKSDAETRRPRDDSAQ